MSNEQQEKQKKAMENLAKVVGQDEKGQLATLLASRQVREAIDDLLTHSVSACANMSNVIQAFDEVLRSDHSIPSEEKVKKLTSILESNRAQLREDGEQAMTKAMAMVRAKFEFRRRMDEATGASEDDGE